MNDTVTKSPLGKKSTYISEYDPSLLFPIPRRGKRKEIGVPVKLPFHGADIWTAYELSWLNDKGKPMVALAEFIIPAESKNLIESKSLKLYLNAFNQSTFTNQLAVQQTITKDLTKATGAAVTVRIMDTEQAYHITQPPGECTDDLDITIESYEPMPDALSCTDEIVSETLHSRLLKSNCLVTGQPDWATVIINYQGRKLDRAGLLKYLISFRNHNEFHEQCVERIFIDIQKHCQPEQLTVYARYTRRGGIDINPFRSTFEPVPQNVRLARQ